MATIAECGYDKINGRKKMTDAIATFISIFMLIIIFGFIFTIQQIKFSRSDVLQEMKFIRRDIDRLQQDMNDIKYSRFRKD